MAEVSLVNLPLDESHSTLVMISQHWFRYQAITWTNVDPDLCRLMASPRPNELTLSSMWVNVPSAGEWVTVGDTRFESWQLVSCRFEITSLCQSRTKIKVPLGHRIVVYVYMSISIFCILSGLVSLCCVCNTKNARGSCTVHSLIAS